MDPISTLASAAAAGNASALADLLEAVWPDAYRIAWSILRERTAAEDAAQEACARALSSIAALREPTAFTVWFYRIVVNEARRRSRRLGREVAVDDETGRTGASFAGADTEDRIDVRHAVASLEPALRVVVVLHYYFALSCAEIAKVVAVSPVTVRWRLLVARRRLRARLAGDPPRDYIHPVKGVRDEHQLAR